MSHAIPLKVEKLSLHIGSHCIFKDFSFEVEKHQFISLMGENGAGKTCLLETLLGLRKTSSGQTLFWGKRLQNISHEDFYKRVAYVSSSQESYPPGISVGELLQQLQSIYPSWNANLAQQLLEDFRLEEHKKLSHLSLGEHSKIRLIKAIAFEPELIILDELTANLSPTSKDAVQNALIDMFARTQMSVLYVCHSHEEALRLSDQIITLGDSHVQ